MSVGTACGTGASQLPVPANCQPGAGSVLEGELEGETWRIAIAELPDITMLDVTIGDEDMGAVEAGETTWLHAESGDVVVLTGPLPSVITQAVGILADGSSVAFCPFGGDGLLVAGGAVSSSNAPVNIEMRQGTTITAIGHVAEVKELADSSVFAFTVTPPGGRAFNIEVVRSPGSELTFDETSSSTTAAP
jgi:hypothetical protein